jgi:predicted lipoprotein with Yx(FWY)xxD motif
VRTSATATESPARRLRLLTIAGAVALMAASVVSGAARAQDDEASVGTSEGDLGTYLVDGAGATLYYFEPDAPGASVCTGDCLTAWPALAADLDQPPLGDETVTGTFGSIARDDGNVQATYRGRPLYYFAGDQAAGDTNGHAVSDVWWVAAEDGSLPNATAPAEAALTLQAASSDLGDFITAADGRTAYYFSVDSVPGVSACVDDCLAAWPPVTPVADGAVAAGEGIPGVVGLITATDGSSQVTYDGRPLYYFAGDQAAGDTNGQAISDVWWVATVDGLLPEG